jgi:hypothetical protein
VLILHNPEKQTWLHADASDYAVGAEISQEDDHGKRRLFRYAECEEHVQPGIYGPSDGHCQSFSKQTILGIFSIFGVPETLLRPRSAQFNSEKVKILHAVKGEAYDNNRAIFAYMTSHLDDVSSWTCSTAFFGTLDRQYETLDPKLGAGLDSDQLFQRKTPFLNFIAKFETLAYQCGKTKEKKVEAL